MRDPRPFLTRHALEQMERRHISRDEVNAVLDRPDAVTRSTSDRRARKFLRNVGGRRIVAVVGPSKLGGESVWTVYDKDAED